MRGDWRGTGEVEESGGVIMGGGDKKEVKCGK